MIGNLDNSFPTENLPNYGCYCQITNDNYYYRHGVAQDDLDKGNLKNIESLYHGNLLS
jgi:hypothetical protein